MLLLIQILTLIMVTLIFIDFYITRDHLSPSIAVCLPIVISVFLFSLGLSDLLDVNSVEFFFYYICILMFFIGMYKTRPKRILKSYNFSNYNRSKIKLVIIFTQLSALLIFIIESLIVTPPLLSSTPNLNYMNFGLPIIHHAISLLNVSCVLSIIYIKLSGKKYLFYFNSILSLCIFTLLTQRLSILIAIIVSYCTYSLVFNVYLTKRKFLNLVLLSILFIGMFILLGESRLGGIKGSAIYEMTEINSDSMPSYLALPYIYITIGIQNTVNYIAGFESIYFGLSGLLRTLPLVSPDDLLGYNLSNYQARFNFTTFAFPHLMIVDFGYFAPALLLFFGWFINFAYYRAIYENLFWVVFYLSFILPQSIFLFFADNFFSTTLIIYLIYIYMVCYFIRKRG
ncbi:hypothetical protein PAQU9191_02245 [Photobacterium aquimaris]|uniref:Oligosaccharide repeat unit polymerase n=2 Tax=Photobacterium aquimaris TaxID=512643 RepID=A0A1Y6KY54_9GAMM|nr:hypothetical protein PAQU9191_02245 [Photobacterium aquimaris]